MPIWEYKQAVDCDFLPPEPAPENPVTIRPYLLPIALLAPLVAAGCVSGAPRSLPDPTSRPIPAAATITPETVVEGTLESAVRRALAGNPGIERARARIEAADAAQRIAGATRLPRVDFGAEATHTDNPVYAFMNQLNAGDWSPSSDPNDPDATGHLRLGLHVTQSLYDGGRRAAGRRSAALYASRARVGEEIVERELAAAVANAWLGAWRSESRLKVAQATVEWAEGALEHARVRQEEGALLRADVLSLEVRLAEAREEMIAARGARARGVEALRRLRAIDGAEPDFTVDPSPCFGDPFSFTVSDEHPELRAANLAVEAAREQLSAARGSRRPTIDLFASGMLEGDESLGNLDAESYLAGVRLSWNLLDGGARSGEEDRARAAVREAAAERDEIRLRIEYDVRSAELAGDEARARRATSETALAQAQEAMRVVHARYDGGAATITRLLEAETAMSAAAARAVDARHDELRSEVEGRRAAGLLPLPLGLETTIRDPNDGDDR